MNRLKQFSVQRRVTRPIGSHLTIAAIVLMALYPFVILLLLSAKSTGQFLSNRWWVTLPLHPENYLAAWNAIDIYIVNTVIVVTVTTIATVFLSSLAGYVLARIQFPGRQAIFYLILALMMIPGVLTLVPLFILVRDLQLLNTLWALILPYIATSQVFGIFVSRAAFESMPAELFESARVDGAGEFTVFWRIALPLARPTMATVAIVTATGVWNDLVWPLVALSDDSKRTITVGLTYFNGQFSSDYGPLFAGYVIAAIPMLLLFAFTSRQFVSGLTSGALKA